MSLRTPITLLFVAGLCAGCLKEERFPPPADAGVDAGQPAPDAGEPDAGEPPPPPQRSLVPMHLLGATPLENLVHSPHFDLSAELWFAYSGYGYAELRRHVLASTPTELPVLEVVSASRPRYLVGMARGGEGPLSASVWMGRDAAAAPPQVTVTVHGLARGEAADRAFDLKAEPDSERQLGEIVWQRYAARIDEELLGVGAMVVAARGEGSVYVNGPTLVRQLAQPMPGKVEPRIARARVPSAAEAQAVRQAFEDQRKRRERPREAMPTPAADRW